ncbi:helix-turn-helix domain-containing protein (plasmid) [Streptomyces sp. NBC_00841]|uniref:PucR family transcriptional regulator n=1 Tax=unclassified Streptomyces TaxID=2593676 RepID=UPI0022502714|nr:MULTISPECIES: helix-turn-helix domain-containing protein [unclassified Streptomyces]MCX4537942.1 helix-turn-helix domain-containing protein [Streptomyces sp. NBC_01669]WSA05122.1 helix-turn-helix domain-containing protein [Streptomyces sp. NBC_00841]
MHNPPNADDLGRASATRPGGDVGAPVPAELRALVRDCLDELDELIGHYVAEVSAFDDYRSVVAPDDLRETARACFELLLRLVGGLPVPDDLREVPERLGRRRAHQGVPLERLLQAVRMDFRVLWTAFLERIQPADLPQLTRGAVRVWEAVEFHTVHVHAAYLDEVAVLARERERERTALMGRLLSSDGRDQQLVAQAATLLQVNAQSDFAVVMAPPEMQQGLRKAVAARLAGQATHFQDHNGMLVLVAKLPHAARTPPSAWLDGVPCAVGPVAHGLARVPDVVRVTEAIAATLDGQVKDAVTLSKAWMPVAVARLGEIGGMLADSVLSGLDPLPPHERERLLKTVIAYCESGSIAATTRELYCHRNTVLNRLSRFTQLTGYQPTRPTEAATVLFALQCARGRTV